jgi:hypothetical protein
MTTNTSLRGRDHRRRFLLPTVLLNSTVLLHPEGRRTSQRHEQQEVHEWNFNLNYPRKAETQEIE